MKALELLKDQRDFCLSIHSSKAIIDKYDEAIKALEALTTPTTQHSTQSKFKVGDWVRNTWLGTIKQYSTHDLDYDNKYRGTDKESLHWELWGPRVGEWCWFWYTNCSPILAKYINSDNEDDEEEYIAEVYTNDHRGNRFTCKDCYINCEPFIGELPNFLKEIQDVD